MPFKTLLIYPPAADITQPHPAIPYLAGYLRAKGENVIIKDANLESYNYILNTEYLQECFCKVEKRFKELDNKSYLNLEEQKEYTMCVNSLGIKSEVIQGIDDVKNAFRSRDKFFDYTRYKKCVEFLEYALYLVSTAHPPTEIKPGEYITPHFLDSEKDIIAQTEENVNPFIAYYENCLVPFIRNEKPDLIGISVVYMTQLLQTFALANLIKKNFPGIHITIGGASACRLFLYMPEVMHSTLFKYIDSVALYEGETTLYRLISHLKGSESGNPFPHQNIVYYDRQKDVVKFPQEEPFYENLDEIPPPDYDGYPLDQYFSPALVLPYAPTRGCYWNKCTFCHYGSTKSGTARYREAFVDKVISDLQHLSKKYATNHFTFTVDVLSPKMTMDIAQGIISRKLDFYWNSDLRAENYFTPEQCRKLKEGGCVSVAIGIEAANQRILDLMDKGIRIGLAEECIRNFSNAGIATQVMTFLSFPSETYSESMETIEFIRNNKKYISLFTMGDFELLPGSTVCKNPGTFGIKVVQASESEGNAFGLMFPFEEINKSKTKDDMQKIESEYTQIANDYLGKEFPFVGSVSSNHTFLYFKEFGKDVLKRFSKYQGSESKTREQRFKKSDRPEISPDKIIFRTKYSSPEIQHMLAVHSSRLEESMNKGTYYSEFEKLSKRSKAYPKTTYYILLDNIKWMELPDQIRNLLKLCDGKNSLEQIITEYMGRYDEEMHAAMNKLYSIGILRPASR